MKRLTLISVFASILCSCTLLDENPSTKLSEKAIYSTEDGIEAAMTGCYASFKGSDLWQGHLLEILQSGSLLIHWSKYRTQQSWQQCLDLTMYSNDEYNESAYQQAYAGINRCNTVIVNLKESPVDEAFKTEIEAEARFLRAILYFNIVRMWGDVPLSLGLFNTLSEANLPRTSYIEVYRQILEDLSFAEINMRSRDRQREINGYSERADKYAATAYKACVYDQLGCILSSPDDQPFKVKPDFSSFGVDSEKKAWELALEAAKKVIDESPYKLADKYGDLFRWTDIEDYRLNERIFVIPSSDLCYTCSNMWTLPNYMEGTSHTSAKAGNWGRIRPARWVFQKWAATYGGKKATGRKDGLENLYVSCQDPRFDLTYIYNSYYNLNTLSNTKVYPADGTVSGIDIEKSKAWVYFSPYFRKYLNPRYDANNGYADFYMLRLAEIYLVAAEASAGLSESKGDARWKDAFDYIEVLHKRARHSVKEGKADASMPKWSYDMFSGKEELETAIFWERVFELSGEGHEWFDMRRRGAQWVIDNITTPVNAFMQEPEQGDSESSEGKSLFTTSYFSHIFETQVEGIKRGLLCAFPENEILNNSAIGNEDQNPYYYK